jgi:acetyltransferase-like isoleucine patch superfamily enzyme/acyl carrier protein
VHFIVISDNMAKIILLGAGSTASNYIWMFDELENTPDVLGNNGFSRNEKMEILFFDENRFESTYMDRPILKEWKQVASMVREQGYKLVNTVSHTQVKEKFYLKLSELGLLENLLNLNFSAQSNMTHNGLVMGIGCTIWHHTSFQPFVKLGKYVTISTSCVIGQEVEIGDFSSITAGGLIAGAAKIGSRCYVGAGTTIVNNVTIGDDVFVTAGSVVGRDIPDGMKVIGNPCRFFKWEEPTKKSLRPNGKVLSSAPDSGVGLRDRIKKTISKAFNVPLIEMGDVDQSPETIGNWDSFTHISMITFLEAEFNIRIDDSEIGELLNISSIEKTIRKKFLNKCNDSAGR